MNIGFLITVRLKSTRLPMKVLLDLNGRSVIHRVIDRAKKIFGVNDIVLCTSQDPQDFPLFQIAKQEGVYAFAGHPTDVLKRLHDAARFFRMDYFVGITADNPLFSFEQGTLLVNWVQQNQETDVAYFDNLPIGGNLYIIKTRMLEIICEFKPEGDTEIWGEWVKQPDFFNVSKLDAPPQLHNLLDKNIRMTMDEILDYHEFIKLYNTFSSSHTPTINEIAGKISDYNLFESNKKVVQQNVNEEYSKRVKEFYKKNRNAIHKTINFDCCRSKGNILKNGEKSR